jgi:hypothetical protein
VTPERLKYQRERYHARKRMGRCPRCPGKRRAGAATCDQCRDKDRDRKRAS